jgi:hypothetical protein
VSRALLVFFSGHGGPTCVIKSYDGGGAVFDASFGGGYGVDVVVFVVFIRRFMVVVLWWQLSLSSSWLVSSSSLDVQPSSLLNK